MEAQSKYNSGENSFVGGYIGSYKRAVTYNNTRGHWLPLLAMG